MTRTRTHNSVATIVRLIVAAFEPFEVIWSQVMERVPLFVPSVSWNWAAA